MEFMTFIVGMTIGTILGIQMCEAYGFLFSNILVCMAFVAGIAMKIRTGEAAEAEATKVSAKRIHRRMEDVGAAEISVN